MSTTQPIKNRKQLTEFRNYYKNHEYNPRNYALIVFGLNSALRIGDILSLRWRDVFCEETGTYRNHVVLVEKKTGKENIVALNNSSKEAFNFYKGSLRHFYSEYYIFANNRTGNHPLSRSQAFRIIKKAALHCGMENHISCHSLRKTFGYQAWQNGTPPALLMSIYNHSSYEITKHYLCIDQVEKDEVYRKTFL